jgi:hypothetical protein
MKSCNKFNNNASMPPQWQYVVLAAIFMFTKVSIKRNENAIAGMINVT